MKYYIFCPYLSSSSSESLHKLCSCLNSCGFESYMVYEGINFPADLLYRDIYSNLRFACEVEDGYENVMIFPEIFTREYMVKRLGLKRIRLAVWWLSIDNAVLFGSYESLKKDRTIKHFYQSQHALENVGFGNFMLNDLLDDKKSFIEEVKYLNSIFHNECCGNDLGVNILEFENLVSSFSNSIFVDLGVRSGVSSLMMLNYAVERNNEVYGIDVDFSNTDKGVLANPRYRSVFGDSSSIGKVWNGREITVLFVDTIHASEQVMCELFYWHQYVREGGWIVFHDTEWPEDKHEQIGGRNWDQADKGLKNFFGIDSLNYEDEFILVEHYPSSWGMTFVKIKKKRDYVSLFKNWPKVFADRNYLTSIFWNESNCGPRKIDLILP